MRRVHAILVGLSVAHVGCLGGECFETRLRAFEVPLPADPAMQFRIDRCQIDEETCVDVCSLAAERVEVFVSIDHCKLVMEADRAVAFGSFEVFAGNGGACAIEGDDVPLPPSGSDF